MPLRHYHRKLDAGFVALPQMTGRRFGMPFILSPPTLTLRFRQNNGPTPSGDYQPSRSLSMAGSEGAIVTLDERKSKLRLAFPLLGKKAEPVKDAILMLFKPIQGFVETITFDNGKEFTLHEILAKELDCDTYFAKPYHSWERGQNENANGLLRQYFPKAMELVDVTIKQVFDAVDKLNSRPRKCLKFKTPYEVFKELTGIDVKKLMEYALMT